MGMGERGDDTLITLGRTAILGTADKRARPTIRNEDEGHELRDTALR